MKLFLALLIFISASFLTPAANIPLYTVPQTNMLWMLLGISSDGSNIVKIDVNLFAPSNSLWWATNGLQAQIAGNVTAITNLSTNLQAQINLANGTNAANTAAITALTPTISDLQARADAAAETNYANMLGLRFATNTLPPIGSIIAWAPSLTNALGVLDTNIWQRCDGQTISDINSVLYGYTLPNLNAAGGGTQRFLRGSTTSGTTGGADSHVHTFSAGDSDTSSTAMAGSDLNVVTRWVPGTTTENGSSLPSYYEVVWLMRVR